MKRQGKPAAAAASLAGAAPPAVAGPLVSMCISQQNRLEVFPVSVRVKRPGTGNAPEPPDRSGSSINSFSAHSRRRLRFRALNASPALVSQFGLTYHEDWPVDGRLCKSHLNAWLMALRRILPGVGYLWILEFQKRNAPHYHVWLTVSPDRQAWSLLAEAWARITGGTDEQRWWHGPERGENWIAWDMGSGAYLCKYFEKEAQKFIPPGYVNFGRFWGNSRGLEAEPVPVLLDDLDQSAPVDQHTGEVLGGSSTVIRWLGRLAEKQTNGYSRFRSRAPHGSYSILQGAAAFHQICRYFDNLNRRLQT